MIRKTLLRFSFFISFNFLGIDCKIHGLLVVGRKRSEEDEFTSTVSFLASDSEECDDSTKTKWNTVDVKVNSTKVFVWGLNDKDQLGGQKVRTSIE